jgi:hypothetical protein
MEHGDQVHSLKNKYMNQTLNNIRLLEKILVEVPFKGKHKSTVYSENSEEVVNASIVLGAKVIYPNVEGKNYYWFTYKNSSNPRISIRVKGPYL